MFKNGYDYHYLDTETGKQMNFLKLPNFFGNKGVSSF